MIETYSDNVVVESKTNIPLNNVSIEKGCTVTKNGSTISLNRCGVYEVCVDASVAVADTTEVSFQLKKNNVLQPQALAVIANSAGSSSATNIMNAGFTALVQVPGNNTPCCCSSGVQIEIENTGAAATYRHINCVITKLC